MNQVFDENGDEDQDEANGGKSPCRCVLQSATSSTGRHVASSLWTKSMMDEADN